MTKVSVIIPNYNHAKFLEARLESIFAQTYQDYEVIFIDDGSSDDSRHVFERVVEPHRARITAIFNESNSGNPFKQWNKGALHASGEYLWIAESDDYAHREFLEKLVPVLDDNPGVGIVYCRSQLVDEFGIEQDWSEGKRSDLHFVRSGRQECREYLVAGNSIPNASGTLIRKSVLQHAGYADETMRFCGDWLTWVKVLLVSDVAYIAEPLSFFRIHPGSVSARLDRTLVHVEERFRVVQFIVQNVDVSRVRLAEVCDAMMGVWLEVMFTHPGHHAWRHNRAIYRVSRAVDPAFHTHVIKRLVAFALAKAGLLGVFRMLKNGIGRPALS
jgi:glycosyltransferase involved in cell wall biosynthesis